MGNKHQQRGLPPATPRLTAATDAAPSPRASVHWRGIVVGQLLGAVTGVIVRPLAALILGFASVFLALAWQVGPQPVIDRAHYASFTAHADGQIVDSWLALAFDPTQMGSHVKWRPFANAEPCAIVEYSGDWGQATRRAFCGNRFPFYDGYTLHDLDTLAPNVPFAWMHDARGFAMPQVRMSAAAKRWLAANAPPDTFMMIDPPPKTELDALQVDLDRPLDYAIAGRRAVTTFPIALDPHDPAGAMPQGFVDARTKPWSAGRWILVLVMAAIGLAVWIEGMAILLSGVPLYAAILAGALPLLALPWWGAYFPGALARLSPDVASVIGAMFEDFDPTGRMTATEPTDAAPVDGENLIWTVGGGRYAETLGRIRFDAPSTAPTDANAVLATLADTVTAQVGSFDAASKIALFDRLREDKHAGLRRAGAVFVPAAKAALLVPGEPAVALAARRFLLEWTTSPIDEPDPRDPAYRTRIHLFAILGDVPVPEIANSVSAQVAIDNARH
jgi:hypothetical protein